MDGWMDWCGRMGTFHTQGVCLGSAARKPLNPLIYLAVLFDMELMSTPWHYVRAWFSVYLPENGMGERASKTFRLSSCSSGFSRRCAAGKVLLGWWFLSFTLSLSFSFWVWFVRAAALPLLLCLSPIIGVERATGGVYCFVNRKQSRRQVCV